MQQAGSCDAWDRRHPCRPCRPPPSMMARRLSMCGSQSDTTHNNQHQSNSNSNSNSNSDSAHCRANTLSNNLRPSRRAQLHQDGVHSSTAPAAASRRHRHEASQQCRPRPRTRGAERRRRRRRHQCRGDQVAMPLLRRLLRQTGSSCPDRDLLRLCSPGAHCLHLPDHHLHLVGSHRRVPAAAGPGSE